MSATAEYARANDETRARLHALVARLGPNDLARAAFEDWSVSALLAHLAFWDRFAASRFEKYLRDREAMVFLNDAFFDHINAAGRPQWTATPLGAAAADAMSSADAVDGFIARLSPEQIAAIQAIGRPGLLDRSGHRNQHLDQLERALE